MALVKDFVLQTANAPGTATFNLIAPPSGRRSFVSANGAGQVFYVAFDNTSFEEGIGTVAAGSPDTLSRDTVTDNSLGTTAKINFTGTTTIWCDIPAARAIYASPDNLSVPHGNRILSGVAAGVAVSDAPRLDQVPWQLISSANFGTVQGAVDFTLPSNFDSFMVEYQNFIPTVSAPAFMRLSQDNGATYKQGASDYTVKKTLSSNAASTPSITAGATTYVELTQSAALSAVGRIDLDPVAYFVRGRGEVIIAGGTLTTQDVYGVASMTARPTNIRVGFVSTTCAAGRLRLLGGNFS